MNINPALQTKLTLASILVLMAGLCAFLGLLPLIHVLSAALLVTLLWAHEWTRATPLKVLSWIGILVVGMFMALYRPEGFSYFNSISVEQLHAGGKPFQQFINLGKWFGALIIFCWLMQDTIKTDIRLAVKPKSLIIISTAVATILCLATLILNLQVALKLSYITLIFLAVNLVITCFSEETFYRLVVQKPSEKAFSIPVAGRAFGVLIASTFFTLTHFSPQTDFHVVMALAGTLYAITYALTRSVSASIFVHFFVNALHFMLLTYPL